MASNLAHWRAANGGADVTLGRPGRKDTLDEWIPVSEDCAMRLDRVIPLEMETPPMVECPICHQVVEAHWVADAAEVQDVIQNGFRH